MILTPDQIERRCESMFDRIDARLMRGEYTQTEYDTRSEEINQWCEMHYRIWERCKHLWAE